MTETLVKYNLTRVLAAGETKVLAAVIERLDNIITPAIGYAELREANRPVPTTPQEDLDSLLIELRRFSTNIRAALRLTTAGTPLPEITEGMQPMVDFKYTDYTQSEKSSTLEDK